MGFNFISDQPEQKMVDTKTVLSVNETPVLGRIPKNRAKKTKVEEVEDLTQPIVDEEQLKEYAMQFIEESELMVKFYIWIEIQEQLKQINLDK